MCLKGRFLGSSEFSENLDFIFGIHLVASKTAVFIQTNVHFYMFYTVDVLAMDHNKLAKLVTTLFVHISLIL